MQCASPCSMALSSKESRFAITVQLRTGQKISVMFKKNLPVLAALVLIASSCTIKEQRLECLTPVSVHVNDFRVTIDTFSDTKATDVASYTNLKALTLAFYSGETEVYKSTQFQGDEAFGNFSLNLPLGTYTMVVLGYSCYEDDVLTLTSPTSAAFTAGRVGETFAYTQEVTVSNTDELELSATLDRIVAMLKVISNDNRPAGAQKVRMTFSAGGKAFNPTTGLATSNTGFSNTVNISTAVGERSGSISYLFLDSIEQTINVTVDVLDGNNEVLYHKVMRNVPFKRNRTTKLTGKLYTATASGSTTFQVNDDWLTDTVIPF